MWKSDLIAAEAVSLREGWARVGGGRYFDATDGEGLNQAVRGAIQESFEVVSNGKVVAAGTVGGDAVELPVGEVRVRTASGADLGAVTIAAEKETTLRLDE